MSKNENFEKIFQKLKRASKIGYKTCATCPQRRFSKKVKILSFFKKGGLKGQKTKILKKYFKNRKGLKKLDIKHVPHSQKVQKNLGDIFGGIFRWYFWILSKNTT